MSFGRIIGVIADAMAAISIKSSRDDRISELQMKVKSGKISQEVFDNMWSSIEPDAQSVEDFIKALPNRFVKLAESMIEGGYSNEFSSAFIERLKYCVQKNINISYLNSYELIFKPILDSDIPFSDKEFEFWLEDCTTPMLYNISKTVSRHFSSKEFMAKGLLAKSESISQGALEYILKKYDIVTLAYALDDSELLKLVGALDYNPKLKPEFKIKKIFDPLELDGILVVPTDEDMDPVESAISLDAADGPAPEDTGYNTGCSNNPSPADLLGEA